MQFEEELARVLPLDIPHRHRLVEKAAQHLRLICSANEYMNLTRITNPHDAVIKHVYDSVAPWKHFLGVRRVLDAGTGAGFPGVPLAVILPETRFTLAESIQKKARFVDSVVESLELANVHVAADRAEARIAPESPEIITARAVAPLHRILELFAKALRRGSQLLLYKGPDVEAELHEAQHHKVVAEILCRYDLPDGMGSRTLVRIQSQERGARTAS
ncbi:MAG: 16S rRNA (guanine(527)-N(7))-methyltransferase RsmG [Acidobacteriaceae bacterium]|nr:16S rRNA (guanine(527)-N(7))-methyltransferase RsmG [Acidobacteriaceae bacterium]MBV8570937.1 16S rRNA (guanine(527)-N(7))-methyltransferase RsmG [Acidobacteriaceae bacterium]